MLNLSVAGMIEKSRISSDGIWLLLVEVALPDSEEPLRLVRNNEDIDLQLEYLQNNLKPGAGEWLPTTEYHSPYKMTADEYIHSHNDTRELAKVFHAHFERSADDLGGIEKRSQNALKWYKFFNQL